MKVKTYKIIGSNGYPIKTSTFLKEFLKKCEHFYRSLVIFLKLFSKHLALRGVKGLEETQK
jgi:hypothetical protein